MAQFLLLIVICIQLTCYAQAQTGSQFEVVKLGDAKHGMSFVEVAVGPASPSQQTFKLLVNTGSADTWIFSAQMSDWSTCGRNRLGYSPTDTAQTEGRTGWIKHGNWVNVSGQLYSDSFGIGQVQVHNVPFLAVAGCEGDFLKGMDCDGVLGLGSFSYLDPSYVDFIQHAASQNALNVPVFTLDLRRKQITFGENTKLKPGEAQFFQNSDDTRWQVAVRFGGQFEQEDWTMLKRNTGLTRESIEEQSKFSYSAILDSSTNMLVLPTTLAYIVNKYVGARQLTGHHFEYYYQLGFDNCNPEGRPTVEFELLRPAKAGTSFKVSIEPEDYMIQVENPMSDSNATCISAFIVYPETRETTQNVVFGNLILAKYSMVFDSLNGLIGFY